MMRTAPPPAAAVAAVRHRTRDPVCHAAGTGMSGGCRGAQSLIDHVAQHREHRRDPDAAGEQHRRPLLARIDRSCPPARASMMSPA